MNGGYLFYKSESDLNELTGISVLVLSIRILPVSMRCSMIARQTSIDKQILINLYWQTNIDIFVPFWQCHIVWLNNCCESILLLVKLCVGHLQMRSQSASQIGMLHKYILWSLLQWVCSVVNAFSLSLSLYISFSLTLTHSFLNPFYSISRFFYSVLSLNLPLSLCLRNSLDRSLYITFLQLAGQSLFLALLSFCLVILSLVSLSPSFPFSISLSILNVILYSSRLCLSAENATQQQTTPSQRDLPHAPVPPDLPPHPGRPATVHHSLLPTQRWRRRLQEEVQRMAQKTEVPERGYCAGTGTGCNTGSGNAFQLGFVAIGRNLQI